MSDVVNRGSHPGDPSADTVREAFEKINEAFDNADEALDEKVDKVEGKGLSTDDFISDGHYPSLRAGATTKDDVGLGNVENYGVATEAEARAGVVNDKYMTPKLTSDHFSKRVTYGIADPDDAVGDDGDLYFQYED